MSFYNPYKKGPDFGQGIQDAMYQLMQIMMIKNMMGGNNGRQQTEMAETSVPLAGGQGQMGDPMANIVNKAPGSFPDSQARAFSDNPYANQTARTIPVQPQQDPMGQQVSPPQTGLAPNTQMIPNGQMPQQPMGSGPPQTGLSPMGSTPPQGGMNPMLMQLAQNPQMMQMIMRLMQGRQ